MTLWPRRFDPARYELLEARIRRNVPVYPGPPPQSHLHVYRPGDPRDMPARVGGHWFGRTWRWRVAIGGVVAGLVVGCTLPLGLQGDGGEASAATVLQRAATQVASQTRSQRGDVLHVKFIFARRVTERVGDHQWTVTLPDRVEQWLPPSGDGQSRLVPEPAVFQSPRDRHAWQAAGSPHLPTVPAHDVTFQPGYVHLATPGAAGQPPDQRELHELLMVEQTLGAAFLLTAPSSVGRLPDSPRLLERVVDANMTWPDPSRRATFWLLASLLRDGTSPAQDAAIYRVLATLPGMQESVRSTDLTNRPGDALTLRSGSDSYTMIIDPSTGALDELSYRTHARPAWATSSGLPSTKVAVDGSYTVFEASKRVRTMPAAFPLAR